ncbi:hypothetical protein HHK36_024576 [Tetracentron sinense]|uniref:J domain-containing protein n=1 Tax=Tetracentron sinense TaxID=13715 RepID=A0A834YLC8_TETSI|nr:hypothetical protein HHK36_024576 [Tetracentron sinense]
MDHNQPSRSYYSILGVHGGSSFAEIRSSYRKLAMQWHPDRWARTPSHLGEAKRKFQQIQEAYSVLSDQRKRAMYDAGFYDPDEEEDEGFSDFLQEILSLMANVRREEKSYSMEELQQMLLEMAKDSEQTLTIVEDSRSPKRARCERNPGVGRDSHIHVSGLEMFERSGFCS